MAEPKPKVDMTKLLAFCKDFVAKKPAMNRFRKQCEKQVLNEFDNAVKQAIKTVEEESKKLPKDDKLIKKQYKTLVSYMMDEKVFGRNNFYTTDVKTSRIIITRPGQLRCWDDHRANPNKRLYQGAGWHEALPAACRQPHFRAHRRLRGSHPTAVFWQAPACGRQSPCDLAGAYGAGTR